jgi:hypothetical protein
LIFPKPLLSFFFKLYFLLFIEHFDRNVSVFFVVAYWNVEKIQKKFHSAIFLRFCYVCFFFSLSRAPFKLSRALTTTTTSSNNSNNDEKSSRRYWSVTNFLFLFLYFRLVNRELFIGKTLLLFNFALSCASLTHSLTRSLN